MYFLVHFSRFRSFRSTLCGTGICNVLSPPFLYPCLFVSEVWHAHAIFSQLLHLLVSNAVVVDHFILILGLINGKSIIISPPYKIHKNRTTWPRSIISSCMYEIQRPPSQTRYVHGDEDETRREHVKKTQNSGWRTFIIPGTGVHFPS
jgi:hypothetical protein